MGAVDRGHAAAVQVRAEIPLFRPPLDRRHDPARERHPREGLWGAQAGADGDEYQRIVRLGDPVGDPGGDGAAGMVEAEKQRLGECPIFCVSVIWSMLPERSKDDDDFERTAGRTAEGLQAA